MEKSVSAANANRKFSKVLRAVREGQRYVVTSHGRAVARIVPVGEQESTAPGARATLLKRLRSQRVKRAVRWTRSELYEDQR
jgi:prevent-host-death family protein